MNDSKKISNTETYGWLHSRNKISRKGSMNATRYMSKYTHKLSFMLHFNRNILTLTTKSSFTAIPFIFIPLLLTNFFLSVYFMYINKCINKKKIYVHKMKYILMCYTWKKIVTLAGNMTQAFAGHKREMWEHQQNRKKIQAIAIFEHQHATTYSTRMDVESFEWGRKKNEASENGKKRQFISVSTHILRDMRWEM